MDNKETIRSIIQNVPLPPPLDVQNIYDEHFHLLEKTIVLNKFASYHIEIYDDWLTNVIPNIIKDRQITINERDIKISFVEYLRPINEETNDILTPQEARLNNLSYLLDVIINVSYTEDDKVEDFNMSLGKIPLMVGSKNCILNGKSGQELVDLGEDPKDPFTYFIIYGTEKIITMKDILKYDQNQLVKGKENVFIKINTKYNQGNTEIYKVFINSNGIFEYYIDKEENINVLFLFEYLLGSESKVVEIFTSYVKSCIYEPYKSSISYTFPTITDWYNKKNNVKNLYNILGKVLNVGGDEKEKKSIIIDILDTKIFRHLNKYDDSDHKKMLNLSSMVAKICEHKSKYREANDIDSWSNKQVLSPANVLDSYFRMLLKEIHKKWSVVLSSKFSKEGFSIGNNIMEDKYVTAFNTNKWKSGSKQVPKSETASRNTMVSILSHVTKMNVEAEDNLPVETRTVHGSFFGFICPSETPDDMKCGMIKNLAITTRLSVDIDPTEIINTLIDDGLLITGEVFSGDENYNYLDKLDVNGEILGWCDGEKMFEALRKIKTSNVKYIQNISVVRETNKEGEGDGYIYLITKGSRLMRPLLIVENGKTLYDSKNLRGETFLTLLEEGVVEYLSPWEQEYIFLSSDFDMLKFHKMSIIEMEKRIKEEKDNENLKIKLKELKNKNYTHCELDPLSLYGISASLIPFPNHCQGPRLTYQSAMYKQTMQLYHVNHLKRFDGATKTLAYPSKPIVYSKVEKIVGTYDRPMGEMCIVAFMTGSIGFEGMTQEDSIILNKSSVERGKFNQIKYVTHRIEKNSDLTMERILTPGTRQKDTHNDNGLPYINAYLEEGDVIVGMVMEKDGKKIDKSLRVPHGGAGTVIGIKLHGNAGKKIIAVKMKKYSTPEVGDKLAARYSQKATVGKIVPMEDMPFTSSGLVPDILINPHVISSRMTMGFLFEVIAGKASLIEGEEVDATAFRPFDIDEFIRTLRNVGYSSRMGYEKLTMGTTGKQIGSKIFIGPAFYQVLKHLISEKGFSRSYLGRNDVITKDPARGKSKGGGLKIGYMSKDSLITMGATSLVLSKTATDSAETKIAICNVCEEEAIGQYGKIICENCKCSSDFSVVKVKQSYKYTRDLLAVLGIRQKLSLKK